MPKHVKIKPSLNAQQWHHSRCFACGPDNPAGLNGDFLFDENIGEVNFTYTAGDDSIGAPGYLHGGVLAALMDEAQGVFCHHIGYLVMTEKLEINYHKATKLNQEFQIRAWLSAVRKRRLYTRACIVGNDGITRIESKASWYILPNRLAQRMLQIKDERQLNHFKELMEANRKRAKAIRKRLNGTS